MNGQLLRQLRERVERGGDVDHRVVAELLAERDALERFVVEAMHLAQYGERAPGGNETWAEWFARAENYLRRGEAAR